MEKEEILAIANTAKEQLFWSIDRLTYMSWGVSKLMATMYQGMPTLMMRVSGMIHKGWVAISLNMGSDYYEVRLLDVSRTKVKHTQEGVDGESLGTTIDSLIEKPEGMNVKVYRKKALRDSEKKWAAISKQ